MSLRGWILLATLAAAPPSLAAQALDSLGAHALVVEMAEDMRSLTDPSDLRGLRGLPALETFFGIEFHRPAEQEGPETRIREQLDEIHRQGGAGALLDEAVRLDAYEDRPTSLRSRMALETIARRDGPREALEAARARGLLDIGFSSLLSGVGLRRIDEVLEWIEHAELDPEMRFTLRARTLGFGARYHPHHFWQRADSLPEPYRTQIRAQALGSTAGTDTVPDRVLEAELPKLMAVAGTLEEGGSEGSGASAAAVRQAVAATCARRRIEVCADLILPPGPSTSSVGVDVINLTAKRAFGQAENRLEELRRTEPPLVVARWMAQGLEALGRTCLMDQCDLVQLDSLAAEWVEEIRAAEAAAMDGRIERTATWNGRDDLTELQRSLALFLSPRDVPALRELLGRMEDPAVKGAVLRHLLQRARPSDLVDAVELYLDFAPPQGGAMRVPHTELLHAGRPDLADRMLGAVSPTVASGGLVAWAWEAVRAGDTEEAQHALRTLMAKADYESPVGGADLLQSLEAVRMLDDYLAHVRALPTPVQRLYGLYPLVLGWVELAPFRPGGSP